MVAGIQNGPNGAVCVTLPNVIRMYLLTVTYYPRAFHTVDGE